MSREGAYGSSTVCPCSLLLRYSDLWRSRHPSGMYRLVTPNSRPLTMPITADLTRLSSRVAGRNPEHRRKRVSAREEGPRVGADQPADYQGQVDQADANISAQVVLENLGSETELRYTTIAQAEAARMSAEALASSRHRWR